MGGVTKKKAQNWDIVAAAQRSSTHSAAASLVKVVEKVSKDNINLHEQLRKEQRLKKSSNLKNAWCRRREMVKNKDDIFYMKLFTHFLLGEERRGGKNEESSRYTKEF